MLGLMNKGTYKHGTDSWDFYQDDEDKNTFYIVPKPAWVEEGGAAKFQLTVYKTSDQPGAPPNGSGYCQLDFQLQIPDAVLDGIRKQITSNQGHNWNASHPIFVTLPVQAGSLATVHYPDGHGGTDSTTVKASDFGTNIASCILHLDKEQVAEVKKAMQSGQLSPFEIDYVIHVPSRMPAVRAELHFDATLALNYEVTTHQHEHKKWAHKTTYTYTYDIRKTLSESNASTVKVHPYDPNLERTEAGKTMIEEVRNWGQSIITKRVEEQVEKALKMQQSATGHQSFTEEDVTSFSETYEQDEAILFTPHPIGTLPAPKWEDKMETDVNLRQYTLQVTPNVYFVNSDNYKPNEKLTTGKNPPFASVERVKQVEVTLHYPTMAGKKNQTKVFTTSQPQTWTTEWDETAGDAFSLTYTATYASEKTVSGEIDSVDGQKLQGTSYTLTLEDIGTLRVSFDATRFFAGKDDAGGRSAAAQALKSVESIEVDFVFNTSDQPYLTTFLLNKAHPTHTVTSLFPEKVGTDYVYTLTYKFKPDQNAASYTTNAKELTSPDVRIASPDEITQFTLFLDMGTEEKPLLQSADVTIYYENEPDFPDIEASHLLPRHNQESPIQIQASPDASAPMQQDQFPVFANSIAVPLTITVDMLDADFNTINNGPYQFDPTLGHLLPIKSGLLFAFLTIDPSIVHWKTDSADDQLMGIDVVVPDVYYHDEHGELKHQATHGLTRTLTWDKAKKEAFPIHYFVTGLPNGFTDISFDWHATYKYKSGIKVVRGHQESNALPLPTEATQNPPNILRLDPSIIQWNKGQTDELASVTLMITQYTYQDDEGKSVTKKLQSITRQFVSGEGMKFYPIPGLSGDFTDLSFDWEATYNYKSGQEKTNGKQKGTVLTLPAAVKGGAQAG